MIKQHKLYIRFRLFIIPTIILSTTNKTTTLNDIYGSFRGRCISICISWLIFRYKLDLYFNNKKVIK